MNMTIYGLSSFQAANTALERFLPKKNIDCVIGRCQKLGIILKNKVIWKLMLNANNIEKDSDDFWHKKIDIEFWHFLTPPH